MVAPGALGVRHPEVDRLRRLLRRRSERSTERAFVLEGPKLLAEALDANAPIEAVFVPEGASVDLRGRDVAVRVLSRGVLERIAGTVTPQPVLAVCPRLDVPLEQIVGTTFVVVCVDLQDPGNAGTVLRSAEAAGADAVVFAGASVDPFNPKAVRASAGSLFHVPVVCEIAVDDTLGRLREAGFHRLGAAVGGTSMYEVDLTGPVALVVGNEAHGLGDEVEVDSTVAVPMVGRTESLNVGMAAAVLCFEVSRQRRGEVGEARGAR
jgi:TrmH family RNA methyltransferase